MFSAQNKSSASDPTKSAYNCSGPIIISRGTNLITGSHLETPWNYTPNDEGKKRGKSYWYSGAFLLQAGPAQGIRSIRYNNKVVYWPIARNGDAVTSIYQNWGDYGIRFRVYWGTAAQPVDPRLNGVSGGNIRGADGTRFICNAAPNRHPAYNNLMYAVHDTLPTHWGVDPGTAGTHIADLVYETYTLNEFFNVGGESERYGVNPIGFAYDLWKSSLYGYGISDARVPLSAWQAKAQAFYDEFGSNSYISPLITNLTDVASIMSDIMSYFHGFMPRNAASILPDWPHFGTITDTSKLPIVRSTDFLEDPKITENDPEQTAYTITGKYKDFDNEMGDASLTARSPYGNFLTNEAKAVSKDLPWIHDTQTARLWLEREIQLLTRPRLSAEGPLPRQLARRLDGAALCAGDQVLFSDDITGNSYICRVLTSKDIRGKGLSLKLQEEMGQSAALPASQGGTGSSGDDINDEPEHLPADIAHCRPWFVPESLRSGASPELSILVDQPDYATGVEVYISAMPDFSGEEQQLDDLSTFTAYGTLTTALNAAALSATFDPGTASSVLSRSFTASEIADGYMLILVDDEVMILGALSSAGSSTVTYTLTRGAFGTTPSAHAAASDVWIFAKASTQRWTNAALGDDVCFVQLIPVNDLGAGNPTGALMTTGFTGSILVAEDGSILMGEDGSILTGE